MKLHISLRLQVLLRYDAAMPQLFSIDPSPVRVRPTQFLILALYLPIFLLFVDPLTRSPLAEYCVYIAINVYCNIINIDTNE